MQAQAAEFSGYAGNERVEHIAREISGLWSWLASGSGGNGTCFRALNAGAVPNSLRRDERAAHDL